MTGYHDLSIAIMAIGFAQSFYAGIMFLLKKDSRLPDRILAVWLFFISLHMLLSLLNTRFSLTAFPFLPFIYGPLLYIYISTLISEKPRLRYYYPSLSVPVIAFFIVSLIYRNEPVLDFENFLVNDSLRALRLSYAALLILSFMGYSVITFIKLHKHRIKIKNLYSYTSQKITLGWALFVSISFFVLYAAVFIVGFTHILISNFSLDPVLMGNIVLVFHAFAFSIFGFLQDRIYPEPKQKKYLRSGLRDSELELLRQKLLDVMDDKQLYLDPELNILDVAKLLHVPRHHITQVLNEKLGKNFYNFINAYRIEIAKDKLSDPQNDRFTILAVGYDSGFNSKTSFNTLFKKHVGLTPSEYRKKR
ncbi:MAG: helix-turn-helix domain-containing protein [Candidatus Marinimicrobia bacterium]|nr:helix-turn-helix domain-containing protein [Candidatus Neomarinimicrobiota bacterium]